METKFNFKSSVCTSREQSERLLALGLKKETADICLQSTLNDVWSPYIPIAMPYSKVEALDLSKDVFRIIPAWSLGRLIEMMPEYVHKGNAYFERTLFPNSVDYFRDLYNDCGDVVISFDSPNLYDRLIHCIEWLIKEGCFNKDYLL